MTIATQSARPKGTLKRWAIHRGIESAARIGRLLGSGLELRRNAGLVVRHRQRFVQQLRQAATGISEQWDCMASADQHAEQVGI